MPKREFVVTQEAVYIHGVWGPFTKRSAINFADKCAADRRDDGYHRYCVHRLPVIGLDPEYVAEVIAKPGVKWTDMAMIYRENERA